MEEVGLLLSCLDESVVVVLLERGAVVVTVVGSIGIDGIVLFILMVLLFLVKDLIVVDFLVLSVLILSMF